MTENNDMKLSEELEQLLKNLHLKRILELYDEQLSAARRKMFPTPSSSLVYCGRSGTTARKPPWPGASSRRSCRAMVAIQLPLCSPTRSTANRSRLCRTRVRRKAEKHRVDRKHWSRQDWPASGLLLKALENGYRCQFIRAQDLFDEMYASLPTVSPNC